MHFLHATPCAARRLRHTSRFAAHVDTSKTLRQRKVAERGDTFNPSLRGDSISKELSDAVPTAHHTGG
jgi:hypothetical protein